MGNQKIFPSAKLKGEDFAEYLSELLEVEVTRSDIYNDKKKKVFKPHQIPNSSQTTYYLTRIQEHLFPKLNIEEFLSKEGEFSIEGCSIENCYFSSKLINIK